MGGGDGTEMGLVTNQESMTGVGGSLTPDFRDKEESNIAMQKYLINQSLSLTNKVNLIVYFTYV